jgi:hypothetical protein
MKTVFVTTQEVTKTSLKNTSGQLLRQRITRLLFRAHAKSMIKYQWRRDSSNCHQRYDNEDDEVSSYRSPLLASLFVRLSRLNLCNSGNQRIGFLLLETFRRRHYTRVWFRRLNIFKYLKKFKYFITIFCHPQMKYVRKSSPIASLSLMLHGSVSCGINFHWLHRVDVGILSDEASRTTSSVGGLFSRCKGRCSASNG